MEAKSLLLITLVFGICHLSSFKALIQDFSFARNGAMEIGRHSSATTLFNFQVHKKTHEGEKCFKCDLCPYSSISQRHLESHMLIHTDQKPYQVGKSPSRNFLQYLRDESVFSVECE